MSDSKTKSKDVPHYIVRCRQLIKSGEFHKAYELCQSLADLDWDKSSEDYTRYLNFVNQSAYRAGFINEALEAGNEAVEILSKRNSLAELAVTYNNLSAIHMSEREYKLSLDLAFKCLKIKEGLDDAYLAPTYNNIGLLYEHINDLRAAMHHYEQAHRYCKKDDSHGKARILINEGRIHATNEDHHRAIKCYQTAIELLGQSEHRLLYIKALYHYAEVQFKLGQHELVLEIVQDIIGAMEISRFPDEWVRAHTLMARSLQVLGSYAESIQVLNNGVEEVENTTDSELSGFLHMAYADAYKRLGKLEPALEHMQIGMEFRQDQCDLEREKRIQRMESKFLTSMREREAELRSMDRLKQINHELESFRNAASHDLREPIRSLLTALDLGLRKLEKTSDSSEVTKLIELASESGQRILDMLEDLLSYTRLNEVNPTAEPIALQDLAELAVENLNHRINERAAVINLNGLEAVHVNGHKTQLVLLLQNLISNAIKFCPQERDPNIEISAYSTRSDWVIQVKDNGLGFDERFKQKAFDVFRRYSKHAGVEGTGIGLAICRKIMENHKGTIEIMDNIENGACLELRFPLSVKAA